MKKFLRRESEIIFALDFELDTPNPIEFLYFYFKVLKYMIQEDQQFLNPRIRSILRQAELLAIHFIKIAISDVHTSMIKPSLLGGTALYFSIDKYIDEQRDLSP